MITRDRFALALIAACWASGCGFEPTAPDRGAIEGTITEAASAQPTRESPARIWVTIEPASHTETAGLLISIDTEILVLEVDGATRMGGVGDLVTGARYRAWYRGGELLSSPPQYLATRIEVR